MTDALTSAALTAFGLLLEPDTERDYDAEACLRQRAAWTALGTMRGRWL